MSPDAPSAAAPRGAAGDAPLFLRAARGENTSRAPIWFMRQAGRHLAEYRALKEKYSFWEMCRTPEIATEVTLQPIRRYGMDAAILFSDIMTPLPPMGVRIDFRPGPVFEEPVRSAAAVDALRIPDEAEIAPFVGDAIRMIRDTDPVPLIGFGGAPLTLATYCVEGGGSKDFATFRAFLAAEPDAAHRLLEKLTEVTIRYLRMQVQAGAQAIQLFDSWAGLHSEATWRRFALPYNRRVFEALAEFNVPRIYLALDGWHLIDGVAELPVEVHSVDWRVPLDTVRPRVPAGRALQGNLDPAMILAPKARLGEAVDEILRAGLGGPHIFNFGHGMMKEADPAHVAFAVERVRAFDRGSAE